MDKILIPVLIVAGIGLLAGIILAVASAIMAVPKDEKAEAILEVLPGANCGACGFSGCSGYAAALSKGEAQPGLCSPGGEACAKACAELLGTGDVAVEKKTALVHCMGSYDCTSDKMRYDGIDSCAASTLLAGGISSCRYGCMGMGDCAAVCEYGAINVCNGMASIDPAKCRGCAKCTAYSPSAVRMLSSTFLLSRTKACLVRPADTLAQRTFSRAKKFSATGPAAARVSQKK